MKSLGRIVGRRPFVAVGGGSAPGGEGVATKSDLNNAPVGVAGEGLDSPVAEGLGGGKRQSIEAGRSGKGA